MKRLNISTAVIFVILFIGNIFAFGQESAIIPDDASVLIMLSDYQVVDEIIKLTGGSDDQIENINLILEMVDRSRPTIALMSLYEIEFSEMSEALEDKLIVLLPVKGNLKEIALRLSYINKSSARDIENDFKDDGIYSEEDKAYFSLLESGYLAITPEEETLISYIDSRKLIDSETKNAEKIRAFLDDHSNKPISLFVNGILLQDLIANASQDNPIVSTGLNYIYEVDQIIGFLEEYKESLRIVIGILSETSDLWKNTYLTENLDETDYIPEEALVYGEINLRSEYIFNILKTLGILESSGLPPELLTLLSNTLTGNVAVSLFRSTEPPEDIFASPPNVLAFIGIRSYEAGKALYNELEQMIFSQKLDIEGEEVYEIKIEQGKMTNIYLYIGETSLVGSTDLKLIEEYLQNSRQENRVFANRLNDNGLGYLIAAILVDSPEIFEKISEKVEQSSQFSIKKLTLTFEVSEDFTEQNYYITIEN